MDIKHIELDDDIVRTNWQSAEAWLNRSKDANVCCIHLGVIACGDSDKHQHFACEENEVGTLEIDNKHIKNHCLGTDHSNCPLLEKQEIRIS